MLSYILIAGILISCGVSAENCIPDRCIQPLDFGPCENFRVWYYYDTESRQCEGFTYSGCGGNTNRFRSQAKCERTCVNTCSSAAVAEAADPTPVIDINNSSLPAHCLLPKLVGKCRGRYTRYHFDTISGTCKTFTYGGCAGNDNNFDDLASCEEDCVKPLSR